MPFAKSRLYKIGGAKPGLWIYQDTETAATVTASGFFNAATNELRQGDVIIYTRTDTPTTDVLHVTSADGAATVTTTGAEGITAT
jgi:hypothetical protein